MTSAASASAPSISSAIAYAKGDLTRARQFGEQARDIGVEIDDRDLSMGGIQQIAQAELRVGNFAAAAATCFPRLSQSRAKLATR